MLTNIYFFYSCHVLFTHAREGVRFLLVVRDWLREDEINRCVTIASVQLQEDKNLVF